MYLDNDDIIVNGRVVGWVHKGDNNEWYGLSLDKKSWALPVQAADNIKGTGFPTALAAAHAYLES